MSDNHTQQKPTVQIGPTFRGRIPQERIIAPWYQEIGFPEFFKVLREKLEGPLQRLRHGAEAGWSQSVIRETLEQYKALGPRIKLFDDVYLIDLTLAMNHEDCKVTIGRIKTEPEMPGAYRWKGQTVESAYLGQVEEYDIYIGYQMGRAPCLVLRYGDKPEDSVKFGPGYTDLTEAPADAKAVYGEARRRFELVQNLITIHF